MAVLSSCQKEVGFGDRDPDPGTGAANNILGDWKFVGMTGNSTTVSTATMAGDVMKSKSIMNYVTQNNSGSVKITGSQFIFTNLTYDINTTVNMTSYVNGILILDTDMPVATSFPLTNESDPYVRNTNDSLTLTASSLASAGAPVAPITAPLGMKISWASDTLLLKFHMIFTTTADYGGMPATVAGSTDGVLKLKRI